MAQKPTYMAHSDASGGSPAWAAISLGSSTLRTTEITANSASSAMPRGTAPSRHSTAAQGTSTVPVPNTGSASIRAISAASSSAYSCRISSSPASSWQNVTASRMHSAFSHFPSVANTLDFTPLARSSRDPSCRRKKPLTAG